MANMVIGLEYSVPFPVSKIGKCAKYIFISWAYYTQDTAQFVYQKLLQATDCLAMGPIRVEVNEPKKFV